MKKKCGGAVKKAIGGGIAKAPSMKKRAPKISVGVPPKPIAPLSAGNLDRNALAPSMPPGLKKGGKAKKK